MAIAAEIDVSLQAARAAQRAWRGVSVAERVKLLGAFVDAMHGMAHDIVPELAWQMGRPVKFGANELKGFDERARYMIAHAEHSLAPVVPDPTPGFNRYVKREPLGIVLTIAPWNYPYLTAVNTVVPALLAGNSVILKHAAQTVLVGDRFRTAFERANAPRGLFQTLAASHEDIARLIASGLVDKVCFTGSVQGGKAIESAAAGTFTSLGLELGGKDPAYVRSDADLDHAVANLVDGAYYNSGQSCCGIERIYVHVDLYERFVDAFVALTRQYVLGNPLDLATTLGPMARERTADIVREQTAAALTKGARALIDRAAFPADTGTGHYLAPQVLVDVDHSMDVMMEESFGPVVGIMKVHDDEEAVRLMNDSRYGLTASVWTDDIEAAERIGAELDTGTVFMNRCDYLDPALAWTGVKDSGIGATLSELGFDALTRPKSFHLRLPP
jgi:acyl-CoA reductase-like NAD-dependent aldehyde dehydrogenase